MNGRKDDFQISLFGLPKCHFEFSQNDIERMRGFKFIFERLIATDFIKNQMAKTPIVFAGEAETTIPESTWSDFNQKFRPFILQRDRFNYAHVKRIAFRHPRCGPTKATRRQMDRMIDHQEKIANDAYENSRMFDFKTTSGEILSAFDLWTKYVYTYNFHVDISANNPNLPTLEAFDFHPENPNARAHLAFCLVIKMAAFERVYNHICDILYFIEHPDADEATYRHKSRPYPTQSFLEEEVVETWPIRESRGICLLGENDVGPYETIGSADLSVVTKGIEIKEWKSLAPRVPSEASRGSRQQPPEPRTIRPLLATRAGSGASRGPKRCAREYTNWCFSPPY
jgi:hypothetical protein